MKKIISALFLTVMGMTACQKDYLSDPEQEDQPNRQRGKFECVINGEKFAGEFKYSTRNTEDGMNTLTVDAIEYYPTRRKEDYRTVSFTIGFYDGPKEYQFGTEVTGAYSRAYTDETTSVYGIPVTDETAKLNLEEYGSQIKGTFNFRVVNMVNTNDTLTITDGTFDFPVD
ncbi:MAG: hypothetical protein KL787_05835 [Taibaiella sp.]|nr:hypothetical protein [Taibaiella sp.]